MKRVIRDDAAIDIQRCARGFVVRSRISRFSGMIFNSSESPGAKSKRGSGSKDMRKGSNSVPKYQLTHATSFSNTLAGESVRHTDKTLQNSTHCFSIKFFLVVLTFLHSTFPASFCFRLQFLLIFCTSTQFYNYVFVPYPPSIPIILPFTQLSFHLSLPLTVFPLLIIASNHAFF